MSDHYFSESPQSEHDIKTLEYKVPNSDHTLRLRTDAGVFSRGKVDYGSNLLIKTCRPKPNSKVLDIGCGYGVIGLSLKVRDKSLSLTLSDINSRAVELAKYNGVCNSLEIEVINSNGFSKIDNNFDYILVNPPIRAGKRVINTILSESFNYLKVQGELYIVVRKRQGAPTMLRYCHEIFGNCEKINKSGGYWILKSKKY